MPSVLWQAELTFIHSRIRDIRKCILDIQNTDTLIWNIKNNYFGYPKIVFDMRNNCLFSDIRNCYFFLYPE